MILLSVGLSTLSRAQTSEPSPGVLKTHADDQQSSAAERAVEAAGARTDSKGRHLAPHDTFYVLSYVSATTDKGVEGFAPGTEVHFVEVHQPTHTLVVSDGHAQVEVAPSKLTNDMDLAEVVRRNDQTSQAKVAAYVQAEEEAYKKSQTQVADATNKDLEHHEQQEAAVAATATAGTKLDQPPQQTAASVDNGGYYGSGGYGYGSPYSYFTGGTVTATPQTPATNTPTTPAATVPNRVAAPSGSAGTNPSAASGAVRPR